MRIFCTKCLEWEGSFSLTRTHTRAPSKQRCCFFAVTSVTPTILKRRKTLPPNTNIISKQRVVLPKTSGRLTKNIRSFYQKQQVVLLKTTGRFIKNDGLFSIKLVQQMIHKLLTNEKHRIVSTSKQRKSSYRTPQRVAKTLIFHTFGEMRPSLRKRML